MRYYRDHSDMSDVLARVRQRTAEDMQEAQSRFPVGSYVVAETEEGPFVGRVKSYGTNFIGRVVVDFYTPHGGSSCAYLEELESITPAEYAELTRR